MHLTNKEEKALQGEYGEAMAASYRVLLSLGEYLGADRLIPICSSHISGVNYANIGEEGLEFLKAISKDGKVKVKTTLNPCGIEMHNPGSLNPPDDFISKQREIIEIYMKMGVSPTLTCVPYELDNKPRKGSHVAWAESSASIYANSVLGAKTNRESAISSLASAITGKTPNAGMHVDENRKPGIIVRVSKGAIPKNTSEYALLGLYAGRLTQKPIGFFGLPKLSKEEMKALGAAIGTSGSSPMFMLLQEKHDGIELVDYTEDDAREQRESNILKEEPDMILLGCPFYTLHEVSALRKKIAGRKVTKPFYLHISRSVYERAKKAGILFDIENAGVKVVRDVCPSLTPIGTWNGMRRALTDSGKGSFYMRSALKYTVGVEDIDSIISLYAK